MWGRFFSTSEDVVAEVENTYPDATNVECAESEDSDESGFFTCSAVEDGDPVTHAATTTEDGIEVEGEYRTTTPIDRASRPRRNFPISAGIR